MQNLRSIDIRVSNKSDIRPNPLSYLCTRTCSPWSYIRCARLPLPIYNQIILQQKFSFSVISISQLLYYSSKSTVLVELKFHSKGQRREQETKCCIVCQLKRLLQFYYCSDLTEFLISRVWRTIFTDNFFRINCNFSITYVCYIFHSWNNK